MHKYSLTLKSRGLEKEYHNSQILICKRQSWPLLFIYLAISFINLIFLSIDYLNQNGSSSSQNNLGGGEFYIVLSFLILWILSIVMCFVLLYQMPEKFNIFYSFQQCINIIYHIILIHYNLNISDSIFEGYNEQQITTTSSSSQQSTSYTLANQRIQFHVLEGFLLAIILNRGLIGTKFLVKASLSTLTTVSLVFISLKEQERPYIQIPIGFACLSILLSQMYEEDKNKRQDFLVRRKDEEWNKIIKNVLPTNFLIAKYNAKESRIELEQANRKANRELGITNSDTFQKFTKNTQVQRNEIISNEKDLNRILRSMQINSNNNGFQPTAQNNSTQQKDLTLYSLIRCKIEEEFRSQRKTSLCADKKQQIDMIGNQMMMLDAEFDTVSEVTMQGANFPHNRSKRKSASSNQNPQSQNGNNNSNQNQKKISEYIGTYRPNGFDVDKKLLIRVSTFSLNEIFAVITIENETYREKYIKQIKFSTFLEKIFSFQLKKFKESYMVVLNELNRVNNLSIMNQLLYHNVKCMNRVNSYLQYFEFKNSSKHEFSVTEFSLTQEIYKILRSLKHYIVGKRIRTYYENTTNCDRISTDEERLQQIFFMILEHLMVNSPEDGYIAIRVACDYTIANCFKIQIQSTYDSSLLNQLNLQTFNIDELYNDYEIYQNYFVSLRIAIKLITLMGPYNKIEFNKSEKGVLFMSFSIFSDLEVIKQQQIKTQQNISSQQKASSIPNLQQHLQQYQPSTNANQDQSQIAGTLGAQNSSKQNQNETLSMNRHQSKLPSNAFVHSRNESTKNQEQNQVKKGNNYPTLNNLQSANELDESGNVSEVYDEENSFNQWLKLKQLYYSSIAHQKVFDIIHNHLPNPALKQQQQLQQQQLSQKDKSDKDNNNNNNNNNNDISINIKTSLDSNSSNKQNSGVLTSDILIGDQNENPFKGISQCIDSIANTNTSHSKDATLTVYSCLKNNQKLKTIILNGNIEGDPQLPNQPTFNIPLNMNKHKHKIKHQSYLSEKMQYQYDSNNNNNNNVQNYDSSKQLSNQMLNQTTMQLLNTGNPKKNNNTLNNKTSVINSNRPHHNLDMKSAQTKHPNKVVSAIELENDSDILKQSSHLKNKLIKKKSIFDFQSK